MFLYLAASRVAAVFSPKAASFVKGRKNLIKNIKFETQNNNKSLQAKRYWFHCASVGEFEQARPLIERVKQKDNSAIIIVTFFSPSGYNLRKDYSLANHVFYLPMDTPGNVRKFLDYVKPDLAVFVKYEFWRNYLHALNGRRVPLYLISANFMRHQPFFKWWGGMFRKMLTMFTHIFVQDVGSEDLLRDIGIKNVTVAGDTRFDRVMTVMENGKSIPELEAFIGCELEAKDHIACLIAGSTWPEDEQMLHYFMNRFRATNQGKLKLVIAPHEPGKEQVGKLDLLFADYNVVKYSSVVGKCDDIRVKADVYAADVFILDTIGILSASYRYGDFAYVGGGFGAGIHNTLEPAAFGLPVVFGPNHVKFIEAYGLLSCGGGFAVSNLKGYMPGKVDIMNILAVNKKFRGEASEYCCWYISKHKGATDKIISMITPK